MGKLYEDIATIKTDVKWIKETQSDHLNDHRKIRMLVYTALTGVGVSILLALLI